MDRYLMVLGRNGLLPGGLVIPQFVLDHLQAVAEAPDPVSSRRARRGLEAIEALRELAVPVHVARDEVPEVDDLVIKLLTVARRVGLRIGTCSSAVVDEADGGTWPWSTCATWPTGSAPSTYPGERLEVELIREGRQPRQAIGYLPDGDMVVVNDATHMVDQGVRRRGRTVDPAHQPGRHGLRQVGIGPDGVTGAQSPRLRAADPGEPADSQESVVVALDADGHDGRVEVCAPLGAVEGGVAEGEDAPVGGHQPVAVVGG